MVHDNGLITKTEYERVGDTRGEVFLKVILRSPCGSLPVYPRKSGKYEKVERRK
jgi:hypothetical protein